MTSKEPPVTVAAPLPGLQAQASMPDCLVGAGNPNLGPSAYMAATLPTDISPAPQSFKNANCQDLVNTIVCV